MYTYTNRKGVESTSKIMTALLNVSHHLMITESEETQCPFKL